MGTTSGRNGVDQARKGDVNWNAMRLTEAAELVALWNKIEQARDPEREKSMQGFAPEDTRDSMLGALACRRIPFHTFAVLAEGVWRERGHLGWFGTSSDDESDRLRWGEWFDAFFDGLDDRALLTVVDYHI